MKMNGTHPWGLLTSCSPPPNIEIKKNFEYMMPSNVLRDLPFS